MSERPIITLTTDFGLKDPFAGLMKGVIAGINPKANVIDLTHNIQRHNIFEASQTISMSYRYFPPGTIHVVVVDPGVGGNRRPLLVVTGDHFFIGPDNGIFTSIYEECGSGFFSVIHLSASDYFLPMSGPTFHGRDIFAPVAAWLSKGTGASALGRPVTDYLTIPVPRPVLSGNRLSGEIIWIDNFGNGISNISKEHIAELAPSESKDRFKVLYNSKDLPMVNFYAESENMKLAAIINSFGHLELFTFRDSAADRYNIKIGDAVVVSSR